jgi:hypothetical protein
MLRLSMDVPLPLDVVELELELGLCGKRWAAKLASRDFAEDMVDGSCATEMVWKNGYGMVRLQIFITMLLKPVQAAHTGTRMVGQYMSSGDLRPLPARGI